MRVSPMSLLVYLGLNKFDGVSGNTVSMAVSHLGLGAWPIARGELSNRLIESRNRP